MSIVINLILITFLKVTGLVIAFNPSTGRNSFGTTANTKRRLPLTTTTLQLGGEQQDATNAVQATSQQCDDNDLEEETKAVRAPLKFIGPYPCLALRFPQLSTSSQKTRNATGISLDFVLDTAANTNTINAQVASELSLEQVGEAPPGFKAGGAMGGGHTYLLGDCELEGLTIEKGDKFTFMTGLTASALPVASAAAAGLLSVPFFNCFSGVEFMWSLSDDGMYPPSLTFYSDEDIIQEQISAYGDDNNGIFRAPIKPLPDIFLPTVTLRINGINIPALLDTGSPITVLNSQAAKLAAIETIVPLDKVDTNKRQKNKNPIAAFAQNFKEAQETAQAVARGDLLTIAGANGEMVQLLKSSSKHDVSIVGFDKDDSGTENSSSDASSTTNIGLIGKNNLYVGNLPGLSALGGLDENGPPAAVLGMDVLRLRPRMIYRGQSNEIYL